MESKHQNVAFISDENWLNDLEFLTNITQVQLGRATLTNFMCLVAKKIKFPDLDSTNYAASVQKLQDEFTRRFPDFRRDGIKDKLFAHPFDLTVEDSPDECQMELIELQADIDTKIGYSENSLVDFYKTSMFVEGFPICHVMQEKLSPSLAAPTAVSNSSQKMKLTKTTCRS